MKTVFIRYEKWIQSDNHLIPSGYEERSQVVEVEKLTDLNELSDRILSVHVIESLSES